MKVVLGLGNPGPRYAGTRHNIGLSVLARLAERWGIFLSDRQGTFTGGTGTVSGTAVYMATCQVYMNLSGQAALALANKMSRQTANLIVVHDDIDLPLGRVRLKEGGGDGGQKGVRSIATALGDRDFFRVRVGVGRPDDGMDVSDYVLGRFTPPEQKLADAAVELAADALEILLEEGLLAAQAKTHSAS